MKIKLKTKLLKFSKFKGGIIGGDSIILYNRPFINILTNVTTLINVTILEKSCTSFLLFFTQKEKHSMTKTTLEKLNKTFAEKPCDYYSNHVPLLPKIQAPLITIREIYTETLRSDYHQPMHHTKERNIHNSSRHSKHFLALVSYLLAWEEGNKYLVREFDFKKLARLWFRVCFFNSEETKRNYFHSNYPQVPQILTESAISCWEKYWDNERKFPSYCYEKRKPVKTRFKEYALHIEEKRKFGYTLEEIEAEFNHPALDDEKMEKLLELKTHIETYRKTLKEKDRQTKENKKLKAILLTARHKSLNSLWGMKKCKEYFLNRPEATSESAAKVLLFHPKIIDLWQGMGFNPKKLLPIQQKTKTLQNYHKAIKRASI